MSAWYERYIGKKWAQVPDLIESYNCGELVRCVFRDLFNIETVPIEANASSILSVCKAMTPEKYDLIPVVDRKPQELDIAFFVTVKRRSHVGVAVQTNEGLMIMHCLDGIGVKLDNPFQLVASGEYKKLLWWHHKDKPSLGDVCLK